MLVLEWLDLHAGSVQASATVFLVLITIYYAWQARSQAAQAKRTVKHITSCPPELPREAQWERRYIVCEDWFGVRYRFRQDGGPPDEWRPGQPGQEPGWVHWRAKD